MILKLYKAVEPTFGKLVKWAGRFKKATKAVSTVLGTTSLSFAMVSGVMNVTVPVAATTAACLKRVNSPQAINSCETTAGTALPYYQGAEQSSSRCVSSYQTLSNFLNGLIDPITAGIFQLIGQLVEAFRKVAEPLLEMIGKIVDAAEQTFTQIYCCGTPYVFQQGVKLVGGVMNLATCPLDGMIEAVQNAAGSLASVLTNKLGAVISLVLKPLKDATGGLNFGYATVDGTFAADPASCAATAPAITYPVYNPFQELIDAAVPEVAVEPFNFDLFGSIRDSCKSAVDGVFNAYDCCQAFLPLQDGQVCDPTMSFVPGLRCSQCVNSFGYDYRTGLVKCGPQPCIPDSHQCGLGSTCNGCCSGSSSYWFGKAFTACGQEPCWGTDTLCAWGTSCRNCCRGDSMKIRRGLLGRYCN